MSGHYSTVDWTWRGATVNRLARDRSDDALRSLADSELLALVESRDEAALAELYRRFGGLVYTVALGIVGDSSLAEEVMQDTFLRCWGKAGSYSPQMGRVSTWLAAISRNRAIDLLRSRQHQSRLRERAPIVLTTSMATHGEAEEVITREVVTGAISSLPDHQREIIELAYFRGMSQSEIASKIETPLGTVKSRTRAAMEQLRKHLQPHFDQSSDQGDAR